MTGGVVGGAGVGQLDQSDRGPVVAQVAVQVGLEDFGVALVVVEAARVVEQHLDRDRVAVTENTWQPALDGVAQLQAVLGDELQDHRRDVGLGQARDAVVVGYDDRALRLEIGDATRHAYRLAAVAHEQDGAGCAACNKRVGVLLERCLRGGAAWCRRR